MHYTKEMIISLFSRIISFLKTQKVNIITSGTTALVLDIITGLLFGFGGAALFAAI